MNRIIFQQAAWTIFILAASAAAFSVLFPKNVCAEQKINVAVVAGFIKTFQEIAVAFEQKSGVEVEATFTSAGRLYGQIINGAPYDIFLSADKERPEFLYRKGLCRKPFVYAQGEVVLWSSRENFCEKDNWRDALGQDNIGKIAIANPRTAVYGASAEKAMKDAKLWAAIEPKLVFAENLALVFQYASLETVAAGFCALAHTTTETGKKGCFYRIETAPAVVHSACILARTKKPGPAGLFADFLVSPAAETIKRKYGYK